MSQINLSEPDEWSFAMAEETKKETQWLIHTPSGQHFRVSATDWKAGADGLKLYQAGQRLVAWFAAWSDFIDETAIKAGSPPPKPPDPQR